MLRRSTSKHEHVNTLMPSEATDFPAPGLEVARDGRNKYLRLPELLAYLGISRATAFRWMRGRVIPYKKIGRLILFDRAAVDRALANFEIDNISVGGGGKKPKCK